MTSKYLKKSAYYFIHLNSNPPKMVSFVIFIYLIILLLNLKGEFTFFFIREMDVPPLGESNLMGPKKSVEVKFFTVAFFGGCHASSMTPGTHFCHSNSSHHLI